MSRQKLVLPITLPQHITFFSFSEGGVLFVQGTQRIITLNHSAAVIWCLLDQVRNLGDMVSELTARFSVDQETAELDIEAALAMFAQEGFLTEKVSGASAGSEALPGMVTPGPEINGPQDWAIQKKFRFAHHIIELASQDYGIGESYASLMGHTAVTEPANPQTRLWVLPSAEVAGAWDIFFNGRLFTQENPPEAVLPDLFFLTFSRLSEALADKMLLHAAVLEKAGEAMIFPAVAESGKTTLAAALLKNGWRFYSDELAVLDLEKLTVSPFPLPMSIKPGSVDVLEPYYPGLAKLPVYSRTDGKKVRYIKPLAENVAQENEAAPVTKLVFPKYTAGVPARKSELSKTEALKHLADTGPTDRELTERDVEAMISLVEERPCFELVYSSLDEAIGMLGNE